MRIGIIGNGIAGSMAKKIAIKNGYEAKIHSTNRDVASRSALATIRPTWFTKDQRANIEESWAWYEEFGATVTRSAWVSNWRNDKVVEQDSWWLVNPLSVLEAPDYLSDIQHIDQVKRFGYDAVLDARGISLNRNLNKFWGATLVSKSAEMLNAPYRVHHVRPYHSIQIVKTDGAIRLGSSISKDKEKCKLQIYDMLHLAEELGLVSVENDWVLSMGIRTQTISKDIIVPNVKENFTSIGGLHRVGYGLAPSLIARWINSLC